MATTTAPAIGVAGKIAEFPVRELLRMLCLSSRTGSLRLADGERRAHIELDRGNIIRAWALDAHTNLGDILKRRGILSPAALEEAVRIQSAGPERLPLGQILVRLGFATAADVNQAMRTQVQAAILETVKWESGEFTFVDTLSTAVDDISVGVPDALIFSSGVAPAAARPVAPVASASPGPASARPPLPGTGPARPEPIASFPILCIGTAPDWRELVGRLADHYPGVVSAVSGEDPVELVRRALRGTDHAAVVIDGRAMSREGERERVDLVAGLRATFPQVPLLLVHDGLRQPMRSRLRGAGLSALVDFGAAPGADVTVEKGFRDVAEAMSQALSFRRTHAVEDPGR